ncbi:MAG: hypothetical protein AAF960_24435 [Bacteroidota bacterium]
MKSIGVTINSTTSFVAGIYAGNSPLQLVASTDQNGTDVFPGQNVIELTSPAVLATGEYFLVWKAKDNNYQLGDKGVPESGAGFISTNQAFSANLASNIPAFKLNFSKRYSVFLTTADAFSPSVTTS